MKVVVEGVGLADQTWEYGLKYINEGGAACGADPNRMVPEMISSVTIQYSSHERSWNSRIEQDGPRTENIC